MDRGKQVAAFEVCRTAGGQEPAKRGQRATLAFPFAFAVRNFSPLIAAAGLSSIHRRIGGTIVLEESTVGPTPIQRCAVPLTAYFGVRFPPFLNIREDGTAAPSSP